MEKVLFLPTKRRFAAWGQEKHQKPKLPVASGAAWLAEMDKLARMKKQREQKGTSGFDPIFPVES